MAFTKATGHSSQHSTFWVSTSSCWRAAGGAPRPAPRSSAPGPSRADPRGRRGGGPGDAREALRRGAPCRSPDLPPRIRSGRRGDAGRRASERAGGRAARCAAGERARPAGVGGPLAGRGGARAGSGGVRRARAGGRRGGGAGGGPAAGARAAARRGRESSIMQGLGRRGGRARGALQDGAHRSPARCSLGASAVRPRLPGPALGPPLPVSPPLP